MEQQNTEQVRALSRPLAEAKGWIRLVAILSIIYGVLIGLTIVGLLVAWLPIWIGVLLLQTATAIEEAEFVGDQEKLLKAMQKLKSYFTIMGVLSLIGLLFFALSMLFGVTGAMLGGMGMHRF